MPFTLSHPAAVLPLRRLGLPMSAMVAGSMVPDVPLFLRSPVFIRSPVFTRSPLFTRSTELYDLTHSLLGVVTVGPALALVALAIWVYLARDAVVDLAPDPVRLRLPPRARLTGRQWLLAPIAASVGAMTHVGWDAFTHRQRWGVRQVSWLSAEHGPLPGYAWLQYGLSALGLVVVAAAVVGHLRALPRGPQRPRRHPWGSVALPVVVAFAAGVGAGVGLSNGSDGLHAVAFRGVVVSVVALVAGVLLVVAGWQATARRSTAWQSTAEE